MYTKAKIVDVGISIVDLIIFITINRNNMEKLTVVVFLICFFFDILFGLLEIYIMFGKNKEKDKYY